MITSEKSSEIRADRLIQVLLLMQGRPVITAAELAAELEVSVPTARRDLEALAMSGVPVYPTRGRGGGWRLIGGARTDLTGLTEGEVASLLIGLTQSRTGDPEQAAALRKLIRAVPATFREGAQRVTDATVRDVPWGKAEDAYSAETVAELQRAVADRRQVRIEYDGGRGEASADLIPLIVGSRGVRWYLLGAPALDGSEVADENSLRTYRVDRILSLTTLSERGIPPEGFDSAQTWARMVERVEGFRGSVRAVVRVEPWALKALCDRFGVQARMLDSDGAPLVEVSAHRLDALAEQLAGWTSVAEVIEPPEVRIALRELGSRMLERYRDSN